MIEEQTFTATYDTLSEVIYMFNPSVIKIDCEGCEYELLKHTDPRLVRNVDTYVIETHGNKIHNRVVELMNSYGFKITECTYQIIVRNGTKIRVCIFE